MAARLLTAPTRYNKSERIRVPKIGESNAPGYENTRLLTDWS